MPTFRPPTVPNGSLEADDELLMSASDHDRLWSYYDARPRGLNLWKYTDGTYELTDAYPFVTDGVGHVVDVAYYGAHTYTVSTTEAAALTAFLATQGYTADIT